MIINRQFRIDITTHQRINDEKDKSDVEINYKRFLDNAKIVLLEQAVEQGYFDCKQTKVVFEKCPYNEPEKTNAIYYLTRNFEERGYAYLDAKKLAEKEYEELKPFNLVMILEKVID